MLDEKPVEDPSPSSSETAPVRGYVPVRCEHSAQVDPRFLKPHPLNPNEHPEAQIEFFKNILIYQGWRRPITISKRSNYITKGHGAHITAIELGLTSVPVDYQDYDSEDQELADILADNQLARMSTMNNDKLQKIIDNIEAEDFNWELTGLEIGAIDQIMDGFDGWGKGSDTDLSIPVPDPGPDFQTDATPSGGPAAGQPYQVDVMSHGEVIDRKGVIEKFLDNNIRYMQLMYPQDQFAEISGLMAALCDALDLKSHSELVEKLVRETAAAMNVKPKIIEEETPGDADPSDHEAEGN